MALFKKSSSSYSTTNNQYLSTGQQNFDSLFSFLNQSSLTHAKKVDDRIMSSSTTTSQTTAQKDSLDIGASVGVGVGGGSGSGGMVDKNTNTSESHPSPKNEDMINNIPFFYIVIGGVLFIVLLLFNKKRKKRK